MTRTVTAARGSARPAGRSRVGERFTVEVGPGRARRPLRRPAAGTTPRPASSSSGTRCPGERVVVEITEGTEGDRFWRGDAVEVLDAVAGPGRGALPVRRAGAVRRLRLPARRPRPRSASSRRRWSRAAVRAWPGSTSTSIVEAGARRRRTGCAGAPGSATSSCPTGGAGCASTARTTWCPSTTA